MYIYIYVHANGNGVVRFTCVPHAVPFAATAATWIFGPVELYHVRGLQISQTRGGFKDLIFIRRLERTDAPTRNWFRKPRAALQVDFDAKRSALFRIPESWVGRRSRRTRPGERIRASVVFDLIRISMPLESLAGSLGQHCWVRTTSAALCLL